MNIIIKKDMIKGMLWEKTQTTREEKVHIKQLATNSSSLNLFLYVDNQ